MSSATHINSSKVGAADLCDGCLVVLFDDSAKEFYEGTTRKRNKQPTLRHVDEEPDKAEMDLRLEKVAVRGTTPRVWHDELPGLPAMAQTAGAGCHLCQFLRQTLLQRPTSFQGTVHIRAFYMWDYDRTIYQPSDDGLVLWRCEVYDGPNLLNQVNFNIETRNDEMATWLRMDKRRSEECLDANNVEWIKDRVRQCEERCNHEEAHTEFLPTRLIDVGTQEEVDGARLIITSNLQLDRADHPIEYAALSYCWGSKGDAAKQTKTTKSNLSQHLKGMPLSSMSPVIADTIIVCRTLGILYLWVDALCIIQGDDDDWDKESEMMGQVYFHSFLTICPLSSSSCLEGYLGPRSRGLDIEFQSSHYERIRGTYTFLEHQNYAFPDAISENTNTPDMDMSSWPERGWTFQEEVLSLRILFFGVSMCHFQCESRLISENGYREDSFAPSCRNWYLRNSKPELARPISDREKMDFRSRWSIMNLIQKREWTYKEDIFSGISSLAKKHAALTDDTYLAGLWKNNLHYDLTWFPTDAKAGDLDTTLQQLRNQNPYVAPSWSWASQDIICEGLTGNTYIVKGTERPCHMQVEFSLGEICIEPWGKNPFGRLKAAFIKISGKVAPFPSEVLMKPRNYRRRRPPLGYFLNNLGTCQLDWSSKATTVQSPGKMRLLLVSSCCAATSNWGTMEYRANPKENHKRMRNAFIKKNPQCRLLSKKLDSENCRCCNDEGLARNAWGIVIHPAEEPGSFYRVGVFTLLAYSGGTDIFKNVAIQTIKLV